jgi:drug/metabolite transporter (DMT)-like permease
LVVVQFFYGLFPLFAQKASLSFSARAVVSWRIAFGALVLGSIALLVHGRRALPRKRDLLLLLGCSVFGVLGNQTLALEGMMRTTSTHAGLLMTLIPVFTYALAVLIRQEVASPRRAAGIGVALTGALVLLLARSGSPELQSRYLLGNALIAANCLSYSVFLLMARDLVRRTPPLALIAQVYWASLWALPLLARGHTLWPAEPVGEAVWALAYILVFPTAVAYLLNLFALERVPASTTAVYIYLQPLVAGAAGAIYFDERPGPVVLVAAALLFSGIRLATTRARKRETLAVGAR